MSRAEERAAVANQERFDELAKGLATGRFSRGQILKTLAAGLLLSGPLSALRPSEAEAGRKKLRLPTVKSLRAARAQIEAGATDVAVSPGGYFRYRRTFSDTLVTSEELLEGGKPVLTWEHSIGLGSISEGYGDADRDGFAESRMTTSRGKGGVTGESVTIEDYSPQTQALIRRQSYTRTSTDTIHVLWERDDGSGNLVKEAEFDTSPVQAIEAEDSSEAGQQAPAEFSSLSGSGCTAGQQAVIDKRLMETIIEGNVCMRKKGMPELGAKMIDAYLKREVIINCVSKPDLKEIAWIHWWDAWVSDSELEITVNLDKYVPLTGEQRANILWHEMLHLHFGAHDSDLQGDPRETEIDQSFACASLCFTFNPDQKTKCSCARCLGTDKCDKRCKGFANCDADMGSGISVKCNCPAPKEECNGKCLDPCPAGKTRSSTDCTCKADPCDPPCKVGETCCERINSSGYPYCVDTKTDLDNCGGCQNYCPLWGVCNNGFCECSSGDRYCPDPTNSWPGSCCSNSSNFCCGHGGQCEWVGVNEDCHAYHKCASC